MASVFISFDTSDFLVDDISEFRVADASDPTKDFELRLSRTTQDGKPISRRELVRTCKSFQRFVEQTVGGKGLDW